MKTLALAFLTLTLSSPLSLAHEGHNHDAPTTLKAPKGGTIKALDEARVEVVSKGKDLKVYLYDQAMKPADAKDFKIVATAELPRSKKQEAVALTPEGNLYSGTYDAKDAHRYTLKLAVTHAKTARTDNLTFTIEPRK